MKYESMIGHIKCHWSVQFSCIWSAKLTIHEIAREIQTSNNCSRTKTNCKKPFIEQAIWWIYLKNDIEFEEVNLKNLCLDILQRVISFVAGCQATTHSLVQTMVTWRRSRAETEIILNCFNMTLLHRLSIGAMWLKVSMENTVRKQIV